MDNLRGFECYDHLLIEPFSQSGWHVDVVSWRDFSIQWDDYDTVIIRSTWDYQKHPARFMDVLHQIDASGALLANPLHLVRWNIDKTYLKELHQKGIPVVPTRWCNKFDESLFSSFFSQFETDQLILKPVVSANADDTYWIREKEKDRFVEDLERTFGGRPFMVQPFMQSIVDEGEYSLFYFNGTYSHAILKTPKSGDFRVQEERGGNLKLVEGESDLVDLGRETMHKLPEMPLYARIDFVRSADGTFKLMEIELIEPSLYFNMDSDSPKRFVKAFEQWRSEQQA